MRRRTATIGSVGLMVAACAFTAGGEDDLPPLSAPIDVTIPAETPEPAPPPRTKSAAESRRPVLMVPGLPRPRSGVVAPVSKPAAEPADAGELPKLETIDDELPPLDGPVDATAEPVESQEALPGLDLSDGAPPPLNLEPESADEESTLLKASPKKNARPKPPQQLAPRRRLFGLLPPLRRRNESRPAAGSKIEFDPRSDPAADAALKRRVERLIRDSAGPHVRSAEVSVVDRSIVIRARADRFYNRRAVKRQLESLPGLAGYDTRVDIIE